MPPSSRQSHCDQPPMTLPPAEPRERPTNAATPSAKILKFSKKRLAVAFAIAGISDAIGVFTTPLPPVTWVVDLATADRKSTRLNSSHLGISYAVFCLKKKKK